ncbi:hypothetical protein P9D37_14060 [Bacillus haynesii]|uniref:Ger(x)C family spore germination protein n=1 Tax=Bacillus haynesii TaxID=1925021 RepID=UPI002DBBFA52|nr:hypothetical protein [Bacillus haynesii]MEC1477760.1 hypothetical protein [Bacillus haynesii]
MSAVQRINIGILLLVCICLAGCWDNHDIEGLSIVMATGFDKGKENRSEPLELTTQIAVFQSTIQGQTSTKPPYQNSTLAGDSVHEILRNFSHFYAASKSADDWRGSGQIDQFAGSVQSEY